MFEIFDHTADLGIRVEADSFEALLAEAATALTSVLVANPEAIEPVGGPSAAEIAYPAFLVGRGWAFACSGRLDEAGRALDRAIELTAE